MEFAFVILGSLFGAVGLIMWISILMDQKKGH